MTLLNDLFLALETSACDLNFTTTIKLNPDHIIYSGHFPGHPVTPGVIQLQIVHELLENFFCRNLKLISIPGCKFLKILNPTETPQVDVHIEFNAVDELLNIKARGENNSVIFFKLDAIYQFI